MDGQAVPFFNGHGLTSDVVSKITVSRSYCPLFSSIGVKWSQAERAPHTVQSSDVFQDTVSDGSITITKKIGTGRNLSDFATSQELRIISC